MTHWLARHSIHYNLEECVECGVGGRSLLVHSSYGLIGRIDAEGKVVLTIERVLLALPIDANVFKLRCNRRRPGTLARSIVACLSVRHSPDWRSTLQSTRVKTRRRRTRSARSCAESGEEQEDGSSVVSRCTPAFYPTAWSTDSQRCARVAKRCWAPPSAELLCVPASKSPLCPALLTVCCHLHSNSHGFCLSVVDTNRSTCSLCTSEP